MRTRQRSCFTFRQEQIHPHQADSRYVPIEFLPQQSTEQPAESSPSNRSNPTNGLDNGVVGQKVGPEEGGEPDEGDYPMVQQDLDLLDQDPNMQMPSSLPNLRHESIQPA
jgi:hypothetical protein